MNAYDFDKTIYNGDSTADFYKYTFFKYPKTRKYFFVTAGSFFLYIIGYYTKTEFKEKMYSFLKGIPDINEALQNFWDSHIKNIKRYYLNQHSPDDIVISASPEFLLEPVCQRLGIKYLIASRVNPHTGKYTGENCYGEEKVKRLEAYMPDYKINEFYSDSVSDDPVGALAEKSYIVRKDKIIKRDEYTPSFASRFKQTFFAREFLSFSILGIINTLICIISSYILAFFTPMQIAFTLGYALSLTVGYLLNSKITFRCSPTFNGLIKYMMSYIPSFIAQHFIIFITFNIMGMSELISLILSAILAVPAAFALIKIFAFKNKE